MPHEVRCYKPNGKLRRIISPEELDKRCEVMINSFQPHSSSHTPCEIKCGVCGKPAWSMQRTKKYCSKECSIVAYKASAKKQQIKRKEKRRLKREATSK